MKGFSSISLLLFSSLTLAVPGLSAAEEKPLYYGWFFNQEVASGLKNLTDDIFTSFMKEVPDFSEQFNQWAAAANVSNPLRFYTKPVDPNTGKYDPYYHITAKYCGDLDCPDYTARVAKILGQKFPTSMVGYVFSPRTYGIRVVLTSDQQDLFDMESRGTENLAPTVATKPLILAKSSEHRLEYPGIEFFDQDSGNFQPSTGRAHVTLGCAPNVSAVTTGTDLLEVIGLEANTTYFKAIKLDGSKYDGNLVQYGDPCQYFVYYPTQGLLSNTSFEMYKTSSSSKVNVFNFFVPIFAIYFLVKWFL